VISNVLIVANPIAGQGNGQAAAKQIHRSLHAAEVDSAVVLDLSTIDPQQLKSADAIVVIGGDGTLRALAGRCLLARGAIAPLLPVPMGTANLMGKHLGIEFGRKDLGKRVVQSIQRESIRMLDAAEVNGQLFLLMAGVGIDAQIVHELDKVRRGPINVASYFLPAAMALTSYQYHPLTVVADEEEIFSAAPAMALVANIAEYGTGFPLAPHARADDGMLDICVIPVNSPADAVQKFLYAWAGEHLLIEGVVYARGKRIEIYSKDPAPIQIDGDPAGLTPAIINLLPIRVPFIVPV
jgi:YegS/Rv2252/BmrU family lipid kinase